MIWKASCLLFMSFLILSSAYSEAPEVTTENSFEKAETEALEKSPVKDAQGEKYPLTWGEFDPGKGMLVGRNPLGSLSLSFYALVRYVNQQPPNQSYSDHLGRKTLVDTRNDIELHRVMVWLRGKAYDPKLSYLINIWAVNATKNINTVGNLSYQFDPKFNLAVGVDGLPAIRSFNGQHPYFLGTDRHLGDEFFKAGFTMGASAFGQLSKSVFYRAMVGNSFSEIGIPTSQMTRNMAYGASVWVLPTGEFGPRGGYGDYEMHSNLASRFGVSATQSREDANSQPNENNEPKNSTLRLSDGVNLFSPSALAPGVQVTRANATIVSTDAGIKYRGFFWDVNYYMRWLNGFKSSGPIPHEEIFDRGFMTQVAHQVKPQKLEIYSAYTYIWGEFNNPWEVALGANYYPRPTRNWRLNIVVNHIEQSPVNSQFGYYVGGQTGETLILASDLFF
jgi:hypothetical protein